MIIWSGWGILVIPVVAISVAAFAIGAESAGLKAVDGMAAGFVAAAPLLWLLGRKLNGPDTSRTLVDPESGETVVLRRRHALFFIPVQYWAIPSAIVAALLLTLLFLPTGGAGG